MPESIGIAAFVFGAVLLLLAFVGGNFKIFGAELSRTAGPVARGIAGVLGLVLILVALSQLTPTPDEPLARTEKAGMTEVAPKPSPDTAATIVPAVTGDPSEAVAAVAEQGVEALMEAARSGSIASRGLFQDDALLMLGELANVTSGGASFDMSATDLNVENVHFTDASTATATVSYVTQGTMTVLGDCYQAPPASQTTAFMLRLERGRWRIHNIEFVRVREDHDFLPC